MCLPAKVNGVWPFNDAWLRTSLSWARRQAPRNVASILDSARELGIRDAQVRDSSPPTRRYDSASTGTNATMRNGPPLPPSIFIGRATT